MSTQTVLDVPPVRTKLCRHGAMMYLPNDVFLGRSLDLYGEYCQGEVELFAQLIRPGMAVIDAGANIGAHTVYFAKAVGHQGQVVAFEPQRQIYHMLCGNIGLNGLTNVVAHHAGLGRERAHMTVPKLDYGASHNFGGVALSGGAVGDQVPVFTLDWLEPERCHFIKIDVEGMERSVLEGSVETLARHRPVLYVENDRKDKSPALIAFLLGLGYRLYWHITPLYNPANYLGNPDNVFGDKINLNMLCIPANSPMGADGFLPVKSVEDWPLVG